MFDCVMVIHLATALCLVAATEMLKLSVHQLNETEQVSGF